MIRISKKERGRSCMKGSEIRRSMPLFPIGIVIQLTDLSARQIRYYEEHGLITPARTKGRQRLFSLNDIDRLLEIKDLLEQGVNMAGIKQVFAMKEQHEMDIQYFRKEEKSKKDLSDEELRKVLRYELMQAGRFNRTSLRQGDLSRFFH